MRYSIDGVIGEVSDMPGCFQVAISHYVWMPPEMRGKGHGKAVHARRIDMFKEMGYDYVLCTVESTNAAQIKILKSNGWNVLDSFTSAKTGHAVLICGKLLGKGTESKDDRLVGCNLPKCQDEHEYCSCEIVKTQLQQFQNVPSDCDINCEEYPPCKCRSCPERVRRWCRRT